MRERKILAALPNKITKSSQEVFCLTSSDSVVSEAKRFKPDLILVDLHLTPLHGMALLQDLLKLCENVLITCAYESPTNRAIALELGAKGFAKTPTNEEELLAIASSFFGGTLPKQKRVVSSAPARVKKPAQSRDGITFWGTRGSFPVSGKEYMRYGGNTSTLEVRHGKDLLIVDAGSGIRALGEKLHAEGIKVYHLIFSHTHLDHLTYLPSFAPLYDPSCTVHLYAPLPYGETLQQLLAKQISHPFFPVALSEIPAKLIYHTLLSNTTLKIGAICAISSYANHPGATLCFKFKLGELIVGYATDNELTFSEAQESPFLSFFKECTHLIHEAQYSDQEYESRVGWGHTSLSNLATLIRALPESISWHLTHHDPKNSDAQLEKRLLLLKKKAPRRKIALAYEGLRLKS